MIQASKPLMVSYLCVACKGEIKAIAYEDVNRFKQCPFCGAVIVRTTFMSPENTDEIKATAEPFDTAESIAESLRKASTLLQGSHASDNSDASVRDLK